MNTINILESFCEDMYEETKEVTFSSSSVVIVRKVFFVLFAKARTLLKSIILLYRAEQFPCATILLRSLLELYIQMKWISENDTIGLSTRYAELSNVLRMRAYLRTKDNWKDYVSTCKEKHFQERFNENTKIAQKYGYNEVIDVDNWRPIKNGKKRYNIFDMAKDVSMEYEYKVIYNVLCETTHIGPGSDRDYDAIQKGTGLVPRKPEIPSELMSTAVYFLKIYTLTNKEMGQSYKNVTYQQLKFGKICQDISEFMLKTV